MDFIKHQNLKCNACGYQEWRTKGKIHRWTNWSLGSISDSTHAVATRTWVHLVTVEVGAALAAADAREGGDGIPVAIAVAGQNESSVTCEYICQAPTIAH